MFEHLKPGDTVTRMLGGVVPMVMVVERNVIHCGGGWTFDAATGAEIDEELGWGPAPGITGSYLIGGKNA
jgi:hypothetical protein